MFLERIKIPESDHDTVPRVTSEAPSLRSKHLHRNKHKLKLSKKYLRAGPTKTFEFSNEVVERYISGERTTSSQQAGSDNNWVLSKRVTLVILELELFIQNLPTSSHHSTLQILPFLLSFQTYSQCSEWDCAVSLTDVPSVLLTIDIWVQQQQRPPPPPATMNAKNQ